MKRILTLAFSLLFALCLYCKTTQAEIVLTAGTAIFDLNSGVQAVDIFVRSDAADTTLFLTADFQLSAGVFPTTAGLFDQAGMVGVGNIQSPPSSQFTSAGNNSATLSLDFTNPQLMPATDGVLARMFIDTTGLGVGTYNILVTSLATQGASRSVNGSFTITAIPEPSSLCLIGCVAIFCLRRRKLIGV